jgi:hypothetical protein
MFPLHKRGRECASQTSIPTFSGFLPLPLGGMGQRLTMSVYPFDSDEQMFGAAKQRIGTVGRWVYYQARGASRAESCREAAARET